MSEPDAPLGGDEYKRALERRAVVEEKLRHDVREMLEVLKADVPGFFTREAKRRFVAAPEFAARLDDARLAAIKRDVQHAGERAAQELVRGLESWDLWQWDARHAFPESPRNLDANPRVAKVLAKAGDELAAVLANHGFPDAASAKDSYKLPSYFVAGRFMKSLVESYWRNLHEHVELTKLIDDSRTREHRDSAAKRWDQA